MHIEPGILEAATIGTANASAIAGLGAFVPRLVGSPNALARTALATVFFSVFMEIVHVPVGPSELHFVGASAVYFTFGFIPTLFGFAFGLALQGLLFEPQDLVHLGVNTLSLVVPLVATHALVGRRAFAAGEVAAAGATPTFRRIIGFDALYYGGVVAMVGFWLAFGKEPTPLESWLLFALSYLPLVLCEPVFSLVVIRMLKRYGDRRWLRRFTAVPELAAG